MRIDHRPLAHPIATDAVASVNMPTFHSICPDDILVHCHEHILHVASVEPIVEKFEEFHFAGHQSLHSPFSLSKAGRKIPIEGRLRQMFWQTTLETPQWNVGSEQPTLRLACSLCLLTNSRSSLFPL